MMEEESYLDMLHLGDEEGESYIFASPSPIPSSPSSGYSATAAAAAAAAAAENLQHPHSKENPIRRRRSINSCSSNMYSSISSSPSPTTIPSSKTTKNTGGRRSGNGSTTSESAVNASKKPKTKVRKERLGDRIVALQQMVSPYGKSDTASVLHEALGYIRFLHDQVQVLSSPYLNQRLPSSAPHEEEKEKNDLRNRGLCLVPVSCTESMSDCNGADLWSPAAVDSMNIFSSASYKN